MLKRLWDFFCMCMGISSGELVTEDKWAKRRRELAEGESARAAGPPEIPPEIPPEVPAAGGAASGERAGEDRAV